MANAVHHGYHYLAMRRRSTNAAILPDLPPMRRNRSASDSLVLNRRGSNETADQIDISIEIRDLITLNVLHDTYALCKLYLCDEEENRKWRFHGSTEAIKRNPKVLKFETNFALKYGFGKVQLLKIEVCELLKKFSVSHSPTAGNAEAIIIGSAIFRLEQLIGAFGVRLQLSLQNSEVGKSFDEICGSAIVTGRIPDRPQPVVLQFAGAHLEKHEKFFDESTVFFQVYRIENDNSRHLLYQSESIANHSHPTWQPFRLQMRSIADNRNRLLEISVWYNDEVNKNGLIGKFLTSYAKMKYGPGPENVYNVINAKKQSKKAYENSGKFELVKFTDVSFYSFLDYMISGTQLHFAAAIDFSQPTEAGISLTSEADRKLFDLDLQLSLRAIGGALKDYSPNKMFPAFGFGAKIPPAFHDSQEFCLNFETDPACRGLDGIMEAYKKATRLVTPIANACYSHVIYYVAKMAQTNASNGLHYYILTIFTQGGRIVDLNQTVSALVYASKLPISVIFVGIGEGNFDKFHRLSYAGRKLSIAGRQSERELVEFVELNSIIDRKDLPSANRSRIAQQALHQVPGHLLAHMHRNNIPAKPPVQICRPSMLHASMGHDEEDAHWHQPAGAAGDSETNGVYRMRDRAESDRRCNDWDCDLHPRSSYIHVSADSMQAVNEDADGDDDDDSDLQSQMAGRSRSAMPTTREAFQRRFAERMALRDMQKMQIKSSAQQQQNRRRHSEVSDSQIRLNGY